MCVSLARDLEKAVEDLSQLLEEPVEKDTIKSLRQRMMDKTVRGAEVINLVKTCLTWGPQVYVRMRHEILQRDTAEGLAESRWLFTVPLDD